MPPGPQPRSRHDQPVLHADAIEHRVRVGHERRALQQQPLDLAGAPFDRIMARIGFGRCGHGAHSAFHGMTLRSISWNSADVMRPRMPTVTMPTNMMSTCSSSHEFQIR